MNISAAQRAAYMKQTASKHNDFILNAQWIFKINRSLYILSKTRSGYPKGSNFEYRNLRNDNLLYKPVWKTAALSGFSDSSTKHEHPCKDPVWKSQQNHPGKKCKKNLIILKKTLSYQEGYMWEVTAKQIINNMRLMMWIILQSV